MSDYNVFESIIKEVNDISCVLPQFFVQTLIYSSIKCYLKLSKTLTR